MYIFRLLSDCIWALIARLSGWRPGVRTKHTLEWVGVITGALLGIGGVMEWVKGNDALTRSDFRSLTEQAASKDDIQQLKQTLLDKLASFTTLGNPLAEPAGAGARLEKNLEKAVETLLARGRADALKDKTGEAAEAALDKLIDERKAMRERFARHEADLYRQKGALAFLHDTEKARRAYARAATLDPDNADGWNSLGLLQSRSGELDAAIKSFERVLALGAQTFDPIAVGAAIGNLGSILLTRGELNQAEVLYRNSLTIDEHLGRKQGVAAGCSNLGNVFLKRGEFNEAEAMYRHSLALHEQLGDTNGMATDYGNLGLILQARGNLGQAEDMHWRSLAIMEQLGLRHGMAIQYGNLGTLYEQQGEVTQACTYWRKARDLFAQIGAKPEAEQAGGLLRKTNCPTA